jgi:serine phosphatase RsbU (regulator of sigma subunit)/Tfp pilus assembly protein PilF
MKNYFLFCFLLLVTCLVTAQNKQIDSLKTQLKTAKEDTNKVNTLNRLADLLWPVGTYDKALQYAGQAKVLGEKLDFKKGAARAYSITGLVFYNQGNYPEALDNHLNALKLRKEIGDKQGMATSYWNIGYVYKSQGNYPEALKNYLASLTLREELGDKQGIANAYNSIGNVNDHEKNYPEAIRNFTASLKIKEEMNDKRGVATSYINIGTVYFHRDNYPEALTNYFTALAINTGTKDKHGIAACYNNIGNLYAKQGNYTEALNNQLAALKIFEETEDKQGVAASYGNISATYNLLKKYKQAEVYGIKALELSSEIGDLEGIEEANESLSGMYAATGNHKRALETYKAYIIAKDSLNNEENTKKIIQAQMQYEFDKKEVRAKNIADTKIEIAETESRRQRIVIAAVSVGLFLVLILAGVILRNLRLNQKKNKIIEYQKALVEEKHKEIKDSINYAERIQRSFLATKELLDENLNEYFVFFKPKDIVSGDFYWASKLSNNQFALVTADSTGHGVPGAIMSILNISSLEKAIGEGLTQPCEILNHTRLNIIERLKKDGSPEGGKDGMDCSLLSFDFANRQFTYAAANNPVWIIRAKEILQFAPDKMPVGKHDKDSISFTQHTVDVQKGDMVYTLTDGMPDQFGGPQGKKYMHKRLKELLVSIAHLPTQEQKEKLAASFTDWKAGVEQVDDVTLMGVRI